VQGVRRAGDDHGGAAVIPRRPRPETSSTPEPDQVVDPVKACEATIRATLANARAARKSGNGDRDRVLTAHLNWLLGEWRKLRGQS
jgi:hypothetical protein